MKQSSIKTLTKIGMVGSLAVLVLPQFHPRSHGKRHGRDRNLDLHMWAGVALVGFSVWHYNCYQPPAEVQKGGGS